MHFNKKNSRIGPLQNYSYSSYPYCLVKKKAEWLKTNEILSLFRSAKSLFPKDILSYQSFVEDYICNDREVLKEALLE